MDTKQLSLFGDEDVVGSGHPYPWPSAAPQAEAEPPGNNPDQLAFSEAPGATTVKDAA